MTAATTHYDDYPYPDPTLYRPDQIRWLRNDNAPRADNWDLWWPEEDASGKRLKKSVLVIGCGVYEALSVAAQEPLLDVTAIDSSAKTIAISQDLAKEARIANVRFFDCDIVTGYIAGKYDLVIASGVMHHIRDDSDFVKRVHWLLRDRGLFTVMVYGDIMRKPIEDFRNVLACLNVPLDKDGIAFTRQLLHSLPVVHPVREFWESVRQNDSQIVDLFLHPYAKHYAANELLSLMSTVGLRLVRWLNNAVKTPPLIASRCERLGELTTVRCAQILNHSDAKLSAIFVKESVNVPGIAALSSQRA